jgi:hypothetical protein
MNPPPTKWIEFKATARNPQKISACMIPAATYPGERMRFCPEELRQHAGPALAQRSKRGDRWTARKRREATLDEISEHRHRRQQQG